MPNFTPWSSSHSLMIPSGAWRSQTATSISRHFSPKGSIYCPFRQTIHGMMFRTRILEWAVYGPFASASAALLKSPSLTPAQHSRCIPSNGTRRLQGIALIISGSMSRLSELRVAFKCSWCMFFVHHKLGKPHHPHSKAQLRKSC